MKNSILSNSYVVKIDRSFVYKILKNNVMVRTITSMGHELGLKLTAEGIESDTQLSELREMGCEFGQGFFFAKPGPLLQNGI